MVQSNMSAETIDQMAEQAKSWPEEDQLELLDYARSIAARREGLYVMTDEERAAVLEGLEQADRGEFVSDAELDKFWAAYRK